MQGNPHLPSSITDMEHSPWVGGTSTNQAARTKMTGPKS